MAKPDAFDVARNHVARINGETKEIVGAELEELLERRRLFILGVSGYDDKKKVEVRLNLLARIDRLEKSKLGGTSELRWKLLQL